MDDGQEVAAVVDGVLQRVEAADEDGVHARIDVIEDGFGDLLRCADERGRVALGTGRTSDGGEQTLVEDVALFGELEQALGGNVVRDAGG